MNNMLSIMVLLFSFSLFRKMAEPVVEMEDIPISLQ